jgi:hypothetical protein
MRKPLPKLSPSTKNKLNVFLTKIETAPFVSREYNEVVPELINELLRILSEVRNDTL